MKLKPKSLLLLVLALLLMSSCGRSAPEGLDWSSNKTDPERFVWGSDEDLDVSLGEMGLFYSKDKRIRYYDLETKQEYILCTKANCTHMTSKCPAYFPNEMFGGGVDNVAQIDGYVYCTYQDTTFGMVEGEETSQNAIQLLRIDPSTGDRKVIAAFPAASKVTADGPSFYASGIGAVHYCNGYAWFWLGKTRPGIDGVESASSTQHCGVNLETGEVIYLNDYDDYSYSFRAVCANTVYYEARRPTEPLLTEAEFYEHRNEDGTITIDGQVFSEYSEYNIWHFQNAPTEYAIYAYDIPSGETQTVFEGIMPPGRGIPYRVVGEYNGKMLYEENLPDETGEYSNPYHGAYYRMDLSTREKELLFEQENGSTLWIAQGYNANQIFPDGTLLCMNYYEDKADIYVYDLNTGKSTFLFTDDKAITFRIFGEYNGGFLGKHKDHQDDMRFYWISKEDFYAGNLDAAIMYQL